jgi:uncharacterized membrane protein YraQ (UPF0718 family)
MASPETVPTARRETPALELLALLLLAAVLLRPRLARLFDLPAVQMWATVFVSITIQALPFLVLGVLVAGALASAVPATLAARLLPDRPLIAVPAAGIAGAALPGCECGSVPIAGRLAARGANPAAALTFMLSAPAINPVVLVATAVAFPGQPRLVLARFAASLLTAVIVGLVWSRVGAGQPMRLPQVAVAEGAGRWETFTVTARHDVLHAGGWLVVGAMAAATLQVVVPRSALDAVAGSEWVAVAALAALAVVLAICSEADAFVATGLSQFSMTSRLVFLVVGPAVDVKLIALQTGVFGRRFAARFAPLTLVVAVICATLVGQALL